MNRIDFWNDWDASFRLVFMLLAGLIIFMIGFVLVFDIGGLSYFLDWEMTGYVQEVLYPVHSNHSEFPESIINTEISFLLQKVSGTYRLLPSWIVYSFAGLVYLAVMGIASITTYLSRFWFLVCMGLFVLLVAGSGIATEGFLGFERGTAIGAVAVPFIILGYYFHSFNDGVSMKRRFLGFGGLLGVVVLLVAFTGSEHDLLRLSYHAYWPALVIAVFFILVIGHEIVYAILILTTQDEREGTSSNTTHFIVLSLVYLLNVGLVYLRNTNYIDWDLYYINVFLLVSVSTVLGFWGLKGREVLYRNVLPYYPYAVMMYSALAIISFTTIIFLFLSANDPAIEVIEDAIVFGHIGFGGMFFIYIIANFISLLLKNLPVYRVAFKEDNFPYATSRLGGLIVVAAFFFVSNYAPFLQSVTGFFNNLGDLNLTIGKPDVANGYYLQGSINGNLLARSNDNHKSNYMLGALSDDPETVIPKMESAVKKRPSDYAYTTLGYAYEQDNRFFDAIFTYQKGLKVFPNSWALKNNLALLYSRTDVVDSVLFYLQQVGGSGLANDVASTNLLALSAIQDLNLKSSGRDWMAYQNNALAYGVYKNQLPAELKIFSRNTSRLNLFTFSYLKNLGLACLSNGSGGFLNEVDYYLNDPFNGDYRMDLLLLKALNFYQQGEITEAFNLMNAFGEEYEDQKAMSQALLGKWSMELDAPVLASKYFELAREMAYPFATADLAQSYALIDQVSIGQFILNNEVEKLDSTRQDVAERLRSLEQSLESASAEWQVYDFDKEASELENILSAETDYLKAYGIRNPFYERGVLEVVSVLNDERDDASSAYEVLQNAIGINAYSIVLIKTYIDQCLKMGLVNYAEDTIIRLYDLLNEEDYMAFEAEFEQKKSLIEASLDSWE